MPRVSYSEPPKTVVQHDADSCIAAGMEEQLMRLKQRTRGCKHVWKTKQYRIGGKNGLGRVCAKCKLVMAMFYAIEPGD